MSGATILTWGATLVGAMAPSNLFDLFSQLCEQLTAVLSGSPLRVCFLILLAAWNENLSTFLQGAAGAPLVLGGLFLAALGVLAGYWWRRKINKSYSRFQVEARERMAVLTEQNEKLREEVAVLLRTALLDADSREKRAQEEATLRERADVIEKAHEAVVGTDLEGYVTSWNGGAERMYGYTSQEILGRHVSSLYEEDAVGPFDPDVLSPVLEGESHEVELRCRRENGDPICVQWRVWLQREADGRAKGIMGHGVDITQHKKAETDLRTRVRQQAAVAELGQVALAGTELSAIVGKVVSLVAETLDVESCKILELLLDGCTLAVRAEVRRTVGDGHGELVMDETRLPYSLFCDAPLIIEDLRTETRFGGSSLLAEQGMVSGMLVTIQGRTHPAGILGAFTMQPRVFGNDDLNFLQAIANLLANLMESRKAEAALRAERDYSEAIIEGSPAIVCGIDPQGKTTYINPAGERITGYRAEEIVGENWWQMLFPGAGDFESKLWMEELRKGDVRDHELALTARDGQKRIISWNLICFRNHDGEVIEVIGFGRDITRRKQLEEQLGQSQKLEAVGRLAGGVAHDFNNLLTVISGYSDLILEDLDGDSPLHSDMEEINKASERAASLTRQLLAFSRRQVLKPKLISLSSVVADSDQMVRRLIGEDIDLVTLLDSEIGAVRADPGQVEQVLLNLAVNARDAMPHGGRVTIATRNVDLDEAFVTRHPYTQTGRHVLLTFGDTGVGMDDETRSRIFEPFFTTKAPGKGTGLGLSTVYGIVKQSGGAIWVENGPVGGTQFSICLPRVDEPADEGAQGAPAVQRPGASETVLLVEDEPSVRMMVRRILQAEGYHVIEAGEGLEAFELASRAGQFIRLLLTDMVMPHMGGRELAKRLAPVHPEMKVVYMTGYTEQAISDAPFLHKPFTPKGLLAKLREVLDTPAALGRAAVSGS